MAGVRRHFLKISMSAHYSWFPKVVGWVAMRGDSGATHRCGACLPLGLAHWRSNLVLSRLRVSWSHSRFLDAVLRPVRLWCGMPFLRLRCNFSSWRVRSLALWLLRSLRLLPLSLRCVLPSWRIVTLALHIGWPLLWSLWRGRADVAALTSAIGRWGLAHARRSSTRGGRCAGMVSRSWRSACRL